MEYIQNLQATLYEESQARLKLSMELDTKESEVETLQQKLVHFNLDTESINSGNPITLNENFRSNLILSNRPYQRNRLALLHARDPYSLHLLIRTQLPP